VSKSIPAGNVAFFHEYATLPIPRKRLIDTAKEIAVQEKLPREMRVNTVFCSDKVIRRLNRQYRHKDRFTDVLSFPFDEPDFLGEVYVSLPRAGVQARRYGVSYADEVTLLFIHGFLHLLGYDHERPRERSVMEKLQSRYLCVAESR
jgi:probable rRNA maturation factor